MNASAQLLRATVTYVALSAEFRLDELSVDERAELLDVIAAVSVLAVLADVDVMAAVCQPVALEASQRAVVLEAIGEVGDFLLSQLAADVVGMSDWQSAYLDKFVIDRVWTVEALRFSQAPGPGDQLSAAEQLVASIAKSLADRVAAIDAVSLSRLASLGGGQLDEAARAADAAALQLSRPAADSAVASDLARVQAIKALAESIAVADQALIEWVALREFDETTTAIDAASLSVQPAAADAVATSEARLASFAKALLETVPAAELAAITLSRTFSDAAAATDAVGVTSSKKRSEAVLVSEFGIVALSEYAIDYFDEDYVLSDVSTF